MKLSLAQLIKHAIPHLAALCLVLVCFELAGWQQDRAAEKARLIEQWDQALDLSSNAPVNLNSAPLFSKITLEGELDQTRHVLLDNQTRNNHPGVHVLVPFYPAQSEHIILVNRGWQPWLRHSGEWPKYETPEGLITIQGRLSDPPKVGFQLGEVPPLNDQAWPNLMTYFDLSRIQEAFGPDVVSRIILLDPTSPHHLSKDPWPSVNMTPERHQAYAFQWLAIALAIGLIWASLSYRFYWKKTSE